MALPPLPPDTPSHGHVTHDLMNSIVDLFDQLTIDTAAATDTVNGNTAAIAAIQAQQAQQAVDIDHLQQLTDIVESPLPPARLAQVTADTDSLTVSWTAVPGTNITYLVESSLAVDGTFVAIPTTAATEATISGLTPDTAYFVRVSTIAGTLQGPPGTPVLLTTAAVQTPEVPVAPVAPVVTLLGQTTTNSISVQWAAVANATQYEAGYLIASVWTSIVTVPSPTVSATFTGLTANTAYTIRVRGDNGTTLGSLSAPLVISTRAVGPPAPAQVTGGVASNATVSSIDYAWTAFPAIGTPPSDPGVRAPALTIAPGGIAYNFNNLAFKSTATSTPAFNAQVIDLTCTKGQLSFTPKGTATVRAGSQNTTFVSISGVWDDLIASADTITYRSPAALASTTDAIKVDLWVAGSTAPQTGTIAVTITLGASTSESGGYNATGGVTYVPSISGDAGATYTAFPAQTANTITFTGLIASHSYSMRVHAVSQDGVAGIDSTVATLSTAAVVSGPPGVIGDPTGTTAVRAHDFASTFGTNVYPVNDQDGGTKAQIIPQINYIVGGTGHKMIMRCYVNNSDGPTFLAEYNSMLTTGAVRCAPCMNHGATSGGVAYLAQNLPVADTAYVEGTNEPNEPGFGVLAASVVLQRQQEIYAAAHPRGIKVAGASILHSTSEQEAYLTAGGVKTAYLAACDYITSHKYPNNGCYSGNNALLNWTNTANLGNKQVVFTETNHALYNVEYDKHTQFENVGGYHLLCGWALGYTFYGLRAFVWFSMNDYARLFSPTVNNGQVVGLFANSSTNPHRYTTQLAAFMKLTADTGATKATFTPGKINCTVTGLPTGSWTHSGGNLIWLQTSAGDFWGMLFNEQNQFSATTTTVHLAFGTPCALVEDFGITGINGTQPNKTVTARTTLTNVSAIDVVLGTEFRLIHVRKPPPGTLPGGPPSTALTANVTIGPTTTVFNPSTGTNLGNYVDPDGAFTQGCIKVTNAAIPNLTVLFRSDTSGTRDEVVFEYGNVFGGLVAPYPNTGPYSVTIVKGGVTQATISVPRHMWRTRWRWQSAARPVRKTTAQLIAANLIPKFRASVVTGTPAAPPLVPYTPMSLAGIWPSMGAGGERFDIGPVTESQGRYLCIGPSATTDLAITMAQAEGSGTIPWHYRDENTGACLNVNSFPNAGGYGSSPGFSQSPFLPQEEITASGVGSISGTTMTVTTMNSGAYAPGTPIGSSGTAPNVAGGTSIVSQLSSAEPDGKLSKTGTYQVNISQTVSSRTLIGGGVQIDTAHIGAFSYIPFLLTGDPYYLEEMQSMDCFAHIQFPPTARGKFSISQTRGMAWALRTRAQLAKVMPASVPSWLLPKSYYQTWLNTERDYIINTYVNNPAPQFVNFNIVLEGFNTNSAWPVPPNTYFASWEQDFLAMIIGWVVVMGFSDWMPIHNYSMGCVLGRSNGTSGWPRAQPSNYRLQIRPSGGASVTASISGTTMTVTAIASGNLVAGQALSSTGTGTNVTANTTIVSQINSTETDAALSKKGTYQVNISQTVASKTITGATMPFCADWAAAWALRRQVYQTVGPDPTSVALDDMTYPSYVQGALAIANANAVPGALAAYQWLHGQLASLATANPSNVAVAVRYKYAIAEV